MVSLGQLDVTHHASHLLATERFTVSFITWGNTNQSQIADLCSIRRTSRQITLSSHFSATHRKA